MVTQKKHVPPSRQRYEEKHPTISIRITDELKSLLDRVREQTGLTYPKIIKGLLEDNQKMLLEISGAEYTRGFIDGLFKSKEKKQSRE